ncbi:MAG: YicC family protein [Bacteroidales bacterium]|nr:YicC family protein [Bacteroidales bacterium]
MILSMTGYGKALQEVNGKTLTVEIKSLNSKQLDVSLRLPAAYRNLEMELRNDIQRRLVRGKIDCSLSLDNGTVDTQQHIDATTFKAYLDQVTAAAATVGIAPPADPWSLLLRLPGVITTEEATNEEVDVDAVKAAVAEAMDKLVDFRVQEGAMLAGVFQEKLSNIEQQLETIKQYEGERLETLKARITESLEALGSPDYDKNRFEQELIYYIEKLDINEEKTRLANHLNYFKATMEADESQGKKLGFIAQEIGREINTMGSKSNHTVMQQTVVCMKDELEQIKEQVLNVL